MSVQEILAKETKRWKYKDCQEVIASSEATPEQKSTAQERMNSIKQWLDSQKTDGSTIRKTTPTEKAEFTPVPTPRIDTTKIDMDASDKDKIRKELDPKLDVCLIELAHIEDRLAKEHNINNPALAGMVWKECHE